MNDTDPRRDPTFGIAAAIALIIIGALAPAWPIVVLGLFALAAAVFILALVNRRLARAHDNDPRGSRR